MAGNQNNSASISDILTTLQNLVQSLNNASNIYNNVNAVSTKEAITSATVVKTSPGRIVQVSIIVSGSTPGMIYDANQPTVTKAPLWVIPMSAASNGNPYTINMPTDTGILVVPGTGQSVTISWS